MSSTDKSVGFETDHAAVAIRQIGTNALPYLLKWIEYEDSPRQADWRARLNEAVWWFGNKVLGRPVILFRNPDWRQFEATRAFRLLGPHANAVIPDLNRILTQSKNHTHTAICAADVLANLGDAGFPSLLSALNGTNAEVRIAAMVGIRGMADTARPAVPILLKIVAADTRRESICAAIALGILQLEPDQVIPVLIGALSSRHDPTALSAADALAQYGAQAQSALPILTNWMTGNNPSRRSAATNALHSIDPTVFTNKAATTLQLK